MPDTTAVPVPDTTTVPVPDATAVPVRSRRSAPRLLEHLDAERAGAVRYLLARPLLSSKADPDAFRLVARHATWLTNYFEQTCGWQLTVDSSAGFARLAKRAAALDPTRPLRRTRGERVPFDRRRYQLLCLVCAELVRHPVTTIGMLAGAITPEAQLDTSRQAERSAFVDALRALIDWGALEVSVAELDAYVGSDRVNALLSADTARLHRLLVSASAPSSLPDGLTTEEATERLLAEPRYGGELVRAVDPAQLRAADPAQVRAAETRQPGLAELGEEARNRWARHLLGRRMLDDPVVYVEDLSEMEAAYLGSISGRRWLRERAAEAGFELEERVEGFLAVDADGIATDVVFPAPAGNVHQLALLLVDRLVVEDADGSRRLSELTARELQEAVADVLARYPGWARGQREEGGPERLARQAVDLLVGLGLARRSPDGGVAARPALARYRSAPAVVSGARTLFDPPEPPEEP